MVEKGPVFSKGIRTDYSSVKNGGSMLKLVSGVYSLPIMVTLAILKSAIEVKWITSEYRAR